MKKTSVALGLATALALIGPLAGSVPTAAAAGETTIINPQRLERGADIAVPHMEGRTVVDGDVRVKVEARRAVLLGASRDGYVVDTFRGGHHQTLWVAADSPQRTLINGTSDQIVLSDDGTTLAVIDTLARRAVVDIRSAADGELLTSRAFRSYPNLLDLDGEHLLVASFEQGAVDYNWTDNTQARITRKPAYAADLGSNRVAYFTSDPYDGGCSVVAPLDDSSTQLWRACAERVSAFSPTGRRLLTVGLLSDGLGPDRVWERTDRGRLRASYRVRSFFGSIGWESATDLLLEAYGPKNGAVARCSTGECERVSRLRTTPQY